MPNSIAPYDLKKDLIELKEKLDSEAPTKKNIWYVDVDLRKKYDLSFIEAGFFSMISQLQCSTQGCCRAKNYYFIDALGISDKWIERGLRRLSDLNLIWIHRYHTRNGIRRQIVTPDSIRLYQKFLKKHKSWALLKKFQEEFAIINPNSPDPETPSQPP